MAQIIEATESRVAPGEVDPVTLDIIENALRNARYEMEAVRYGVVLGDDLTVDTDATTALREQMRTDRGELDVFDFGPDIDELRAQCEAETGLPAPQAPTFADATT